MKTFLTFLLVLVLVISAWADGTPYYGTGTARGGVTNNGTGYTLAGQFTGQFRGGNPVKLLGFSDSTIQNLRVNGWLSQGGFSNQWSTGGLTNGYLYYNVGAYAQNNISYVDVFTNIMAAQYGIYMTVDLAGSVPGQRGSDIWGTYNGSNYISLTSFEASMNYDQTHGFTYNGSGVSSQVVHGDPLPLTYWPDSTNDVSFTVQGVTYTNLNNTPMSFTVTGTGYVTITFNGTPSFTSVGKVTVPYRAGSGVATKYAAPYTSACDGFNFTPGGNIPAGLWASSNAPSVTGISCGAIVQWGNNDSVATTNDAALWNNQVGFGVYLHSLGISPVILISAVACPTLVGSPGLMVTNFANRQRANWQSSGAFDLFYDFQQTNGNAGTLLQSSNYMDNTHYTTLFAGQNATNMALAFSARTWVPNPLAAGPGGMWDGGQLTNVPGAAITLSLPKIPNAVTVGGSPFTFSNATPNILECYFTAGTTVSFSLTKNGVSVKSALTGDAYILLQPTNKCVITWTTTAPGLLTNNLY